MKTKITTILTICSIKIWGGQIVQNQTTTNTPIIPMIMFGSFPSVELITLTEDFGTKLPFHHYNAIFNPVVHKVGLAKLRKSLKAPQRFVGGAQDLKVIRKLVAYFPDKKWQTTVTSDKFTLLMYEEVGFTCDVDSIEFRRCLEITDEKEMRAELSKIGCSLISKTPID